VSCPRRSAYRTLGQCQWNPAADTAAATTVVACVSRAKQDTKGRQVTRNRSLGLHQTCQGFVAKSSAVEVRPARGRSFLPVLGAVLYSKTAQALPLAPRLLPLRPIDSTASLNPDTFRRFRDPAWKACFQRGVVGTPGTP